MTDEQDIPDNNDQGVGSRLRLLRQRAGLTQAELAGDRVSESYISLLESGRRRPTTRTVTWLAERLGCRPEDLTAQPSQLALPRAELAVRRAEWETSSGQPEHAIRRIEELLESLPSLGVPWLVIRARAALAKALEATGQLPRALHEWEAVVAAAEAEPEYGWHTAAVVGVCRCAREAGLLDYAIEAGENFWQRARTSPRPAGVTDDDLVVVGATLLSCYLEVGDLVRCRELSDGLVSMADQAATPMAVGAAYWNAALTAEAEGRIGEALRLAERAAASLTQTDDVRNRARLQTALGGLHLRTDPPDAAQALCLLGAAEPVLAQFATVIDVAYCRTELARAHLTLGDAGVARAIAAGAVDMLDEAGGQQVERARALMVLSWATYAVGEAEESRALAADAASALEETGATRQAAAAWTELAELSAQIGDGTAALEAYRRATHLMGISAQRPSTAAAGHERQQRAAG